MTPVLLKILYKIKLGEILPIFFCGANVTLDSKPGKKITKGNLWADILDKHRHKIFHETLAN
jgi:hypothetical protein